MKTKIIYISGNEIFDMADIRAAFEEVRNALNLDETTVLFGVPVDAEDAGFAAKTSNVVEQTSKTVSVPEPTEFISETQIIETPVEDTPEPIKDDVEIESVVEQPVKKRGRPRKTEIVETNDTTVSEPEQIAEPKEQVVPILSVLSGEETKNETTDNITDNQDKDIDIIPEISDDIVEQTTTTIIQDVQISADDDEAGLEKLLSAMTPLQEDIPEEPISDTDIKEPDVEPGDISIDATLEQLATEFAENQDKIVSETKSTSRNKIGKLRNILPFKQSKHKDQGLGDLFGWAGIAANDEEFSVPGFFTSAASKK